MEFLEEGGDFGMNSLPLDKKEKIPTLAPVIITV